jgi:hypothetical protein
MSGSADDTKLNVDEATVPRAFQSMSSHCLVPTGQIINYCSKVLAGGGGGDQERMSGPTKFELISYFLQNIFKLKIKFNLKIRENL